MVLTIAFEVVIVGPSFVGLEETNMSLGGGFFPYFYIKLIDNVV